VDSVGSLHLRLREEAGVWKCAEVSTVAATTYGKHEFHIVAPLSRLDHNARVGLFLYSQEGHELDIEFANWGQGISCQNASFSIHPSALAINPCLPSESYQPFSFWSDGDRSIHTILWAPTLVAFRTIGYSPVVDAFSISSLQERTFRHQEKVSIPQFEQDMRVHINLWLDGRTERQPAGGMPVEIVILHVEVPWRSTVRASADSLGAE
jgi:hypothetical protein